MSFALLVLGLWPIGTALVCTGPQSQETEDWVAVPCTVTEHWVEWDHEADAPVRRLAYVYPFEGEEYIGTRFQPLESSADTENLHASIARYPEGSSHQCLVNPQAPQSSYLSGEDAPDRSGIYVGVPVAFLGLAGLLAALLLPSNLYEIDWKPRLIEAPGGRVKLRGRWKRAVEAAVLAFIGALFGVVAVYCVFYYFEHPEMGRVERIMMSIVAAILLLVSGFALWFLLRFLITAMQPRPALTIEPANLSLGQSGTINWEFRRPLKRLRRFRVWLEAHEEYTTSGKSATTIRVPFEKLLILEAGRAEDVLRGQVRFQVPERSMHSLQLGTKQIVWRVGIGYERGGRPPVEDYATVRVLPRDAQEVP